MKGFTDVAITKLITLIKNALKVKQDKITGTEGDFVVIGTNGSLTTKSVSNAEEASF